MATRFLSFVAPAPVAALPARSTLTPCFRFTNSGQATFLPAHHDKSTRPRKFDNNAADYGGVMCVDTVFGMYGADPYGDAQYLGSNNIDTDFDIDSSAEFADYDGDDMQELTVHEFDTVLDAVRFLNGYAVE
jgi:hypothetical protein